VPRMLRPGAVVMMVSDVERLSLDPPMGWLRTA
jgi:hypothetical protein